MLEFLNYYKLDHQHQTLDASMQVLPNLIRTSISRRSEDVHGSGSFGTTLEYWKLLCWSIAKSLSLNPIDEHHQENTTMKHREMLKKFHYGVSVLSSETSHIRAAQGLTH